MYKVILASMIALGVFFTSAKVNAKPTDTEQSEPVKKVQKKKVVKKTKKQPVLVEDNKNAFLKECGIFGCMSGKYTTFNTPINQEVSSAEYFAREQQREHPKPKPKPVKLTEAIQKPVESCFLFFCSTVQVSKPEVVMEAKKWEGKSARRDRKELANLMREGNNVPVDPLRIPWCAGFANAILNRQGYETTGSLTARSFLSWGIKTKEPKEGDIVVLSRGKDKASGHVGFFVGYENLEGTTYVKVLGGNTDHAVQVGYFPVNRVLGYRTFV